MTTLEKEGKVLLPNKLKDYYVQSKNAKQTKDKMIFKKRHNMPDFLKNKGDYSKITHYNTSAGGSSGYPGTGGANTSPSTQRWI